MGWNEKTELQARLMNLERQHIETLHELGTKREELRLAYAENEKAGGDSKRASESPAVRKGKV